MNILLLITGLGVGGAERQVIDLADRFSGKGHNVNVTYILEPALIKPTNPNVKVTSLGGKKNIMSLMLAFIKMVKLLRDSRPDVLHSHMFHANIFARVGRIFVSVPKLVCTAHSTNEGGWLRMLLYRLSNSLGDVFTNVSGVAVAEFERRKAVPKGRMLSVFNGIDTNKFKFNPQARAETREELASKSSKVFIAVGRMVEAKDYPNLLQAFSFIVARDTGCRLWIVGSGPLREMLEGICERLSISNNVIFWGVRHDVERLMSASDIFVLSSRWEGFGLVVAEAMSTERVVVATDCGGVGEVLGDCGYLVPANNPSALQVAMYEAANLSHAQAEVIGSRSRDRVVREFSLEKVVDRWLGLYSDV